MKDAGLPGAPSGSELVDQRILALGDWRGETLRRVRQLIKEADREVVEEVQWARAASPGVPTWSHDGIICTAEPYKAVVKLTFANGAALPDPAGLFNASLDGNTRRAIDIREGEEVDAQAFKALIRAAVAHNASRAKSRPARGARSKVADGGSEGGEGAPVLLSGGNPQIAKGDGDGPVQAYIAAMPGWKRELGARIDALISREVPGIRKAVRWNSPFYGIEGQGWIVSFHVFARYLKVTFFRGAALQPEPPGKGKDAEGRWIDITEGAYDEARMAEWVRQAAALPGWGKV
jgi:hypothetical protein